MRDYGTFQNYGRSETASTVLGCNVRSINCIISGYEVLVQGGEDVFHLVVGLVRSLDAEHPVVHVQYLNLQ